MWFVVGFFVFIVIRLCIVLRWVGCFEGGEFLLFRFFRRDIVRGVISLEVYLEYMFDFFLEFFFWKELLVFIVLVVRVGLFLLIFFRGVLVVFFWFGGLRIVMWDNEKVKLFFFGDGELFLVCLGILFLKVFGLRFKVGLLFFFWLYIKFICE